MKNDTVIKCCCSEEGGSGHELRNVGSLQEAGKGKELHSPQELKERNITLPTPSF